MTTKTEKLLQEIKKRNCEDFCRYSKIWDELTGVCQLCPWLDLEQIIKGGEKLTDQEIKELVLYTVETTIREYKKNGLLKDGGAAAYTDATDLLTSYFRNGKTDAQITYAIQSQRFDPYFRIIQLYFEQGKTLEQIAASLGVDVSTVVRNKKRLCLAIYNDIV